MSTPRILEAKIDGSVEYLVESNHPPECFATASITFWREDDELKGTIHFSGHQSWNANIPPSRIAVPFPDLPSSWELLEKAREALCFYMGARLYVHLDIKLNPPQVSS